MINDQTPHSEQPRDSNLKAPEEHNSIQNTERKDRYERGTAIDVFASKEDETAKHIGNDIATNDGSVLSTLDIAFHNIPGYINHNSDSGSNRADYYESKSSGKADDEEEIEAVKKHADKE